MFDNPNFDQRLASTTDEKERAEIIAAREMSKVWRRDAEIERLRKRLHKYLKFNILTEHSVGEELARVEEQLDLAQIEHRRNGMRSERYGYKYGEDAPVIEVEADRYRDACDIIRKVQQTKGEHAHESKNT